MTLKKLEFERILNSISKYAITRKTALKIKKLKPVTDLHIIKKKLSETFEIMQIINKINDIPSQGLNDISEIIKRVSLGSVLSVEEILNVLKIIELTTNHKNFINSLTESKIQSDYYKPLIKKMFDLKHTKNNIRQMIDDNGNIYDNATPELNKIRKSIKVLNLEIREKINNISRMKKDMLTDSLVTMKNDKLVLMVKNTYKNSIDGNIIGESASGETVYIEPLQISKMSYKITNLKHEEEKEIYRILSELTGIIYADINDLEFNFDTLLKIEFTTAKAKYSSLIEANIPNINKNGKINLINAWHPLLIEDVVIKNNIYLNRDKNLLITGPNTGGKTVILKTVGLLTIMTQSGILIPVDENSDVAVFDNIFADIGDEQSIENSLSTFSSHMTNIIEITKNLTLNSLVLLDELGSGTDPKEGANLAISLIEYFLKRNTTLIATTHYPELKLYAYENDRIENANVKFDIELLKPTYKLFIGTPGSSNAFEISRKLGLNNEILEKAINLNENKKNDIAFLMEKLEKKSFELEKLILINEEKEKTLKQEIKNIELEKNKTIVNQEKLKANAIEEANEIIRKTKEESEMLIKEIKDSKKNDIKDHELSDLTSMVNKLETIGIKKKKINNGDLKVGDFVRILTYNQTGKLITKKGKKWIVKMGVMQTSVKEDDLEFLEREIKKEVIKRNKTHKLRKSVSLELDLRGMRYEDAKYKLDKYLDDIVLTTNPYCQIIHGYGTFTISKLVRKTLDKNKHVKSHRYGDHTEGGQGVTIAYF